LGEVNGYMPVQGLWGQGLGISYNEWKNGWKNL
jgi:hypothetical protein